MKLNNARTILGGLNQNRRATMPSTGGTQGEGLSAAGRATLNSEDPSVAEYLSTLKAEWTKSEGSRVEFLLEDAFDGFKPIAWSRAVNLDAASEELQRTGRLSQPLMYAEADIVEAVEKIQQTHADVVKLDHPAKSAVIDKAQFALSGCAAFASLRSHSANEPVTNWSLGYYGRPNDAVLQVARDILSKQPADPSDMKLFGTEEILDFFHQRIGGLPGWSVVAAPIQAVMSIRSKDREIVVRDGASVAGPELHRLWIHEVGGHVVRTINAGQSRGSLARLKLGVDSTSTEEGLAVWWEHRLGVHQESVMRRYAARALAVDIALTSGASDVMDALAPVVGIREAVAVTLRVKRGMSNAEAPGAFTKDHCYLSGYIAVRDFLTARPDRLNAVMATKWGLEMTPLAEQLIDNRVLMPGKLPWEVSDGFPRPAD